MQLADAMLSTIGELNLRDEYALLPHNAVLADVAKALSPVKNMAVLIKGKKKSEGIVGIVKTQHLLAAIRQGHDPTRYLASNIMKKGIMRLRNDMPIFDAIRRISDGNPDCVLVLQQKEGSKKREHEFVGYLSPEDFRSLGGAQNFYPYDPIVPETVGEVLSHEKVSVKDEFSIVKSKTPMNRVAIELRRPTTQFVLVQSKKKGITGIVTVQSSLAHFSNRKMNPIRTPVEKCMLRNVLRLARNTPVDLAIEIIEERRPDAVLLLNNDKSFFGLLSPSDYEVLKKYGTPEFEHDNSIDNLQLLLRRELSGRKEVPVVWQHGGSDLLLRTPELSVKQKDHNLLVLLPVECDQTGFQIMTFRYYLGSELQMEKKALADRSCDAPEILTKHWGTIIQRSIWYIVEKWMELDAPRGEVINGFGLSKEGFVMTRSVAKQTRLEVEA